MLIEKIYMYNFIGTYLLRTGSIFLIVFGLKVLVSFYKYNVRMSAFRESVASALDLVGISDISKLKDLAEIMNPNKIDFEKSPNYLPEEILALAKEVNKLKGD